MTSLKHVLLALCVLHYVIGVSMAEEYLSTAGSSDAINQSPPIGRKFTEHLIGKISQGRATEFVVSSNLKHVTYLAWAKGKPDFFSEEDGFLGDVHVVLDGKKSANTYAWGSEFKSVASLTLSPNGERLAYFVKNLNGRIAGVNIDGVEKKYGGKGHSPITEIPDIQFSQNSKSLAYVEDLINGQSYVVVDGKKIGPFKDRKIRILKFDSDNKRIICVATTRDSSKQFTIIDGQEGKYYDGILSRGYALSPDSSEVAYFAKNSNKVENAKISHNNFIPSERKEESSYRGNTTYLSYSPDSQHLLLVAQVGQKPFRFSVVLDGVEGRAYKAQAIRNPRFSPDSKHVAYMVSTNIVGDDQFIVQDGNEGKHYSAKGTLLNSFVFSPDSNHIAYSVRLGDYGSDWIVVNDGKEGKRYNGGVGQLVFSQTDSQLAYIAVNDYKQFVVVNEVEGKRYDAIKNLVFSPDGKSLVYAAYSKESNKWYTVVNGHESPPYDYIMLPDTKPDTQEEWSHEWTKGGGIVFDSSAMFHYLAIKNKQIFLVEESLDN